MLFCSFSILDVHLLILSDSNSLIPYVCKHVQAFFKLFTKASHLVVQGSISKSKISENPVLRHLEVRETRGFWLHKASSASLGVS